MRNWRIGVQAALIFGILLGISGLSRLSEVAEANPGRVVLEVLEQASKVSGKTLTPAAREAAEKALISTAARHGDEVLDVVRIGGLEALEQGTKHGDDFWKMCAHSPQSARAFAMHADELMPLARRIGTDVAEFEAKHPGITLKTASQFGDDGIRVLSKAPSKDVSRMVTLAENADSAATRAKLLECYRQTPNKTKFLESLNWKTVMAVGLSSAMVVSAYEVSSGVKDSIETHGPQVLEEWNRTLGWTFWILFLILAFPLLFPIMKKLGPKLAEKIPGKSPKNSASPTDKTENADSRKSGEK